jgi:Zn finger protein HypA/HybF involved in hydrogenase expression
MRMKMFHLFITGTLKMKKGHVNKAMKDIKCRQCKMNIVENEFHFLLVCPKNHVLRKHI